MEVQGPATLVQKTATKNVSEGASKHKGKTDAEPTPQPEVKVNQGATILDPPPAGHDLATCITRKLGPASVMQMDADIPREQIQEPGGQIQAMCDPRKTPQAESTSATRITCPPPAPRTNERRGKDIVMHPASVLGLIVRKRKIAILSQTHPAQCSR